MVCEDNFNSANFYSLDLRHTVKKLCINKSNLSEHESKLQCLSAKTIDHLQLEDNNYGDFFSRNKDFYQKITCLVLNDYLEQYHHNLYVFRSLKKIIINNASQVGIELREYCKFKNILLLFYTPPSSMQTLTRPSKSFSIKTHTELLQKFISEYNEISYKYTDVNAKHLLDQIDDLLKYSIFKKDLIEPITKVKTKLRILGQSNKRKAFIKKIRTIKQMKKNKNNLQPELDNETLLNKIKQLITELNQYNDDNETITLFKINQLLRKIKEYNRIVTKLNQLKENKEKPKIIKEINQQIRLLNKFKKIFYTQFFNYV